MREAAERGEFDGLGGTGRPLRGLDRPFSAERWAVEKARREGLDVSAMLPPALSLRRERETVLRDLGRLRSAAEVEAVVDGFNARVRDLYRRPAEGPVVVVPLLDPAEVRERWEVSRRAPAPQVPSATAPGSGRRCWWRRRRS